MDIGQELNTKYVTWEILDHRINELYQAMLIIEKSGASPELTDVSVKLAGRMGYLAEWRDSLLAIADQPL